MIPKVDSVLVPTDFSDIAAQAIPHAYGVVDDGGTVHLLHVIESIEPSGGPNPLYAHYVPGCARTPQQRKNQHKELAVRLRGLIPEGAAARLIRTEVHVVEASKVSEAITQLADRVNASLVCVASHGRTGLAKALFGSVAREVLAAARQPVLVVRAA